MASDVIKRRRKAVSYFLEQGLIGADGFKEAMLALDFGAQYTNNNANRLFTSPQVQRFIAEEKAKHAYTKEKAVKLLKELQTECEGAKDRTNKLGVIKELDRIHGLYTDDDKLVTINQLIVSPQERRAELEKELDLLNKIDSAPLAIAE